MFKHFLSLSTCLLLVGCLEIHGNLKFRAAVGQAEQHLFEIENTGDETITDIYVTIENLDSRESFHSVIDGCAQSRTLEPGQTCEIGVLFAPFTPGLKQGRISVSFNNRQEFHSVLITGDAYINTAPVASDASLSTPFNRPLQIDIAEYVTDPDLQVLTYSIPTAPLHGTVSVSGSLVTYIPDEDYTGPDSFSFKANDGMGESNPGVVSIQVENGIAQIAVGWGHSCAVDGLGRVKCWGSNGNGQLGLGDTSSRGDNANEMGESLPFVDFGMEFAVMSMAGGWEHTCALDSRGRVKCWGDNSFGKLGLGDASDRGDNPNEMGDYLPVVNLGTGFTVKSIEAGMRHTCALSTDGRVKCWGENLHGELGLGDTISRGDNANEMGDNLPVVDLGSGFTAQSIVAGLWHTCALSTDGQAKCWGRNSEGQLGLGNHWHHGDKVNEMGDNLPVVDLGSGFTVQSISAGTHTCALSTDGRLKCWGHDYGGELGLGDYPFFFDRGDGPNEMGDYLPGLSLGTGFTPRSVSVSSVSSCALSTDSRVKCWGDNGYGQLGHGNKQDRGDDSNEMGDYLFVVNLGIGFTPRSLSANGYFTCALSTDSRVKCWGENSYGQLGQGDTINRGDNPNEMGDFLPFVSLGFTP